MLHHLNNPFRPTITNLLARFSIELKLLCLQISDVLLRVLLTVTSFSASFAIPTGTIRSSIVWIFWNDFFDCNIRIGTKKHPQQFWCFTCKNRQEIDWKCSIWALELWKLIERLQNSRNFSILAQKLSINSSNVQETLKFSISFVLVLKL